MLSYESADGAAELILQHAAAHQARWAEYQDAGSLLLIGPFADGSGAMAVFRSRAAAEEFAAGDPFVLHGVVAAWHVREWLEALTP